MKYISLVLFFFFISATTFAQINSEKLSGLRWIENFYFDFDGLVIADSLLLDLEASDIQISRVKVYNSQKTKRKYGIKTEGLVKVRTNACFLIGDNIYCNRFKKKENLSRFKMENIQNMRRYDLLVEDRIVFQILMIENKVDWISEKLTFFGTTRFVGVCYTIRLCWLLLG